MAVEFSKEEILRYSRHLMIPDVGLEGQRKLRSASVLLVGAGGLGSPIALYLAAAGVGRIGVVDYDRVDASNLQRQVLYNTGQVGQFKAESAKERMLSINPYIQVDMYVEPFNAENGMRISEPYQVLIDGTDNFASRYLVNDISVLTGKPFVYGAVYRFDGQAAVFDARQGACYRCLFPTPPRPEDAPTCAEAGVFGVVPGMVGMIQASETIKLILGIGEPLVSKMLFFNALDMNFQTITLEKNKNCLICGEHPEIGGLVDYNGFCGTPPVGEAGVQSAAGVEIEPRDLAARLEAGEDLLLLDVRDPVEAFISKIPGGLQIPYETLSESLEQLGRDDREIVVYCRTGVRSAWAQRVLENAGFHRVRNLRGGINAWAREVDPTLPQY